MSVTFTNKYLESLPLNKIAKYPGGTPKNAVSFAGYPQQHPSDNTKLILVYDPLGKNPAVLEFKVEDILFVEDFPQAVTEKGEGVPMVKLWIRKGSRGMLLEQFEVSESIDFLKTRDEQKAHFMKQHNGPENEAFFTARSIRM